MKTGFLLLLAALSALPASALTPFLVYFEEESVEISARGERALEEAQKAILLFMVRCDDRRVLIVGHDDKMNSPERSEELAMMRAIAVRDHLISLTTPDAEYHLVSMGQKHPAGRTGTNQIPGS